MSDYAVFRWLLHPLRSVLSFKARSTHQNVFPFPSKAAVQGVVASDGSKRRPNTKAIILQRGVERVEPSDFDKQQQAPCDSKLRATGGNYSAEQQKSPLSDLYKLDSFCCNFPAC